MARNTEKALENIRAVIEQQEVEWLRDNGFDPTPYRPTPRILQRKTKEGNFAANRFLDASVPAEELQPAPQPAPEPQTEPETQTPELHEDNTPEFVEVIPQKDNRHSWLYNEVVKAVRDASGDGRNTKIIAVFVPVVQNGREFEDLPVAETIELSPVDEEAVHVEELVDLNAEPESEPEPEPEPVEPEPEPVSEVEEVPEPAPVEEPDEDAQEMPDLTAPAEPAETVEDFAAAFNSDDETLDEAEALDEAAEESANELPPLDMPELEDFNEGESVDVVEEAEEPVEPVELEPVEEVAGLVEAVDEPVGVVEEVEEPEELEDFGGEPEKLDSVDIVPDVEEVVEPVEEVVEADEDFSQGEKMNFTDLSMPDALDDDEILEDGGIEIQEDPKE